MLHSNLIIYEGQIICEAMLYSNIKIYEGQNMGEDNGIKSAIVV